MAPAFGSKREASSRFAVLAVASAKTGYQPLLLATAGLGIEPKFSLSESDVLPLDDPARFNFSEII